MQVPKLLPFFFILFVILPFSTSSPIFIQEEEGEQFDVDLCCSTGPQVITLTENNLVIQCLNYTNDMNCTWLIVPQNGLAPITLEVSEVDTEQGDDTLTVFDGPAANFPVLLLATGTNPGAPVSSSESYLTVVFYSDSSNDGGNFTFSYSSGSCLPNTLLTPQTFAITDCKGYGSSYLANQDCQWSVNSTIPVSEITLYFEYLHLDSSSNVTITDAVDGSVIGIYSNKSHIDPIVAVTSNVNVEFKTGPSGGSSPFHGFNLTYTAGFCQSWANYQNPNGSFTDGSGSQNYFNDVDCGFLITPNNFDSRNVITISVPFINLEQGDDTVTIYDGPDASYELLATYTGDLASVPVYATSGTAYVRFHSDSSNNYDGFYAEYTTNSCLNQTYWYTSTGSFGDGSGHSFNYTAGLQCTWNILPDAPSVNLTTLYFTSVDLGTGDKISIYSAETGDLVDVIQGNATTLDQIPVEGGNLTVVLTSVTGGRGFNLSYAAGACLSSVVFTGNNGTFNAGQGAGGDYADDLDCTFLIRPTSLGVPQRSSSEKLGIIFEFVDTESGDDYVTVYDGPSSKFPVLASLTGSLQKQGPYYAKEGVLTVEFHSDSSNSGLGFLANYAVISA